MNVQTSATFDCDPINALGNTGNQVVKGAITCAGSQSSPGSSTSGSPSSGGSSSSSSSGAAVPGVTFPVALGGTSILGMLLQFLLSF